MKLKNKIISVNKYNKSGKSIAVFREVLNHKDNQRFSLSNFPFNRKFNII